MSASDVRPLLVAGLLAVAAFSCSDDAPGGDDGAGVPAICLRFTPLSAPAPGTVAAAEGAGSTCDESSLEMVIRDVTDIFGFSFTATFDPTIVTFSGASTAGTLLESDGAMLLVEVTEGLGSVTVGVTRVGSTGIDAVGPETLLALRFQPTGTLGISPLQTSSEKILGSETPPQEKPGILWTGGTLERL